MTPRIFALPAIAIVYFFATALLSSCEKELLKDGAPSADSLLIAKDIVSVNLKNHDNTAIDPSAVLITQSHDSLLLSLPYGVDLSRLIPEIDIKGASISPASGVMQNFSHPVVYTVTARDNSTQQYTVVASQRHSVVLYFGDGNGTFYALNPLTGATIWTTSGAGSFAYADPFVEGNTIYAGSIDGYLYALNASTGAIRWKYFTSNTGIESPPVVAGGTVFFGSNDHYFYALDAHTGELRWRYQTGGNVSTKAVLTDGAVIFGSSDGRLYALDASGGLLWSYLLGDMPNQSSPVLHNGIVFIGSRDGRLYAINAATGQLKWKYDDVGISLEMSTPAIDNGIVYIGGWYNTPGFTRPGPVYAVNEHTGALVWQSQQSLAFGSSPCIAGGKLLITCDDGNLYAFDAASGAVSWTRQIYANSASPAVSNGIVYIGGGGTNNFYAFNLKTGTTAWLYPLSSLTVSTPVIPSDTAPVNPSE